MIERWERELETVHDEQTFRRVTHRRRNPRFAEVSDMELARIEDVLVASIEEGRH